MTRGSLSCSVIYWLYILESGGYSESGFHCDSCLDKRRDVFIKLPITMFPLTPQRGKINPPVTSVCAAYRYICGWVAYMRKLGVCLKFMHKNLKLLLCLSVGTSQFYSLLLKT